MLAKKQPSKPHSTLCVEELPFTEVEKLMRMARDELGSLEDGTPLPPLLELDDE
ncbi:hypothetical protein [Massilia rhizosphaerae]|uniref:hypothetical protein n=1 Tax=Massilia rhizosphaerae TaxID=2784389 RepID=UPI0018DE94CA|nr:hypothetical protein [Massilia rhizosphaerae]